MDVEELSGVSSSQFLQELAHVAHCVQIVLGSKQHKNVPMPPASSRVAKADAFVVQLHSATVSENGIVVSSTALADAQGQDAMAVLFRSGISYEVLERQAMVWSSHSRHRFLLCRPCICVEHLRRIRAAACHGVG